MKKFLLKLAVFTAMVTATIVLLLEFAGGYVDYFYPKFSSPEQTSLIIGDSRSVEGIRPSIIDKQLSEEFELPIYNYSFSIAQATYGDCYLESIKKKLRPETKNGLFILSVNPWMFLKRDGDDYENGKFFEASEPPHNLAVTSMRYNPEHFFKNFRYAHYSTIFSRAGKAHDDGWFEDRNVPNEPVVRATLKKGQIALYSGMARRYQTTAYRFRKFSETIAYLKKHGTVVVVRMPVCDEILAIENEHAAGFNAEIIKATRENAVTYLDFTQSQNMLPMFDGVHLDLVGSAVFTRQLCDSIKAREAK